MGRDSPPPPLLGKRFSFVLIVKAQALKMYPKDISIARLQSLQHVRGAYELLAAMKANKSKEEIMRIYLRYPPLMANFIISRDNYFSCF